MIPHRLSHNEKDIQPAYTADTQLEHNGRKYTATFKVYNEWFLEHDGKMFFSRFDIVENIPTLPNHKPHHTELYEVKLSKQQIGRALRKVRANTHLYFKT